MKRHLTTSILLIFTIVLSTASPVIIQGKWNRNGKDVSLYHIVSGRLEVLSTYNLQADKNFGFIFTPEKEGYYVIGTGNAPARTDKYLFYFKPGDQLNIEVTEDSYNLVGDRNTAENKVIEKWHNGIQPLEFKSVYFFLNNSTYVDFFPLLEEYLNGNNGISTSGNTVFDNSFKTMTKIDLMNTAMLFLHTPRAAHPHFDEYPDYYRNIDVFDLSKDNSLLGHPFGASLLIQLLDLNTRLNDGKALSVNEVLAQLGNDEVKGEYLLSQTRALKSYTGYQELMKGNIQYLVTEDQTVRAKKVEAELAKEQKAGEAAIDFTAEDIDGKAVSLSNFKGKVVYVDAWATWCGPCIAETPHFRKIAEEYAGKEIVFMGVSLDERKDYDKWKEYVKAEKLPGVQLYAGGFGSDIARLYGINSIPRFLLFDKEGNIVLKDAPRPSSNEIKSLLDIELKK